MRFFHLIASFTIKSPSAMWVGFHQILHWHDLTITVLMRQTVRFGAEASIPWQIGSVRLQCRTILNVLNRIYLIWFSIKNAPIVHSSKWHNSSKLSNWVLLAVPLAQFKYKWAQELENSKANNSKWSNSKTHHCRTALIFLVNQRNVPFGSFSIAFDRCCFV